MGYGEAVANTKKNGSGIGTHEEPLSSLAEQALDDYFARLNGHRPAALYDLVMSEVERPLLKSVLNYTNGNQSEAATILGINRGTLRKKLKAHNLLG